MNYTYQILSDVPLAAGDEVVAVAPWRGDVIVFTKYGRAILMHPET